MSNRKIYTVKDAAAILGVTGARVRQLCKKHDIGEIVGTTRILSAADIKMLRATPRKSQVNSK